MLHQLIESFSAPKNRALALPALIVRRLVLLFVPTCLCAFVPSAHGQGQVLFFEDYESGAAGWTYDNSDHGLWHIANDGECLSVTNIAAYDNASLSLAAQRGIMMRTEDHDDSAVI